MTTAAAEPLWMKTLRAQARERFEGMKWPVTSEEEWRRTDVSRLGLDAYSPVAALTPACPREADPGAAPRGSSGSRRTSASRSGSDPRAAGSRACACFRWTTRWKSSRRPSTRCTRRPLAEADNRFLAWHYASLSHGALLWVPRASRSAEPFFIEFEEGGAGTMSAPHVAVLLGAGSRASVVQQIIARAAAQAGGARACSATRCVDMRLADAVGVCRSGNSRSLHRRTCTSATRAHGSGGTPRCGTSTPSSAVELGEDPRGLLPRRSRRRSLPRRRVLLRRRASTWTCAPCSATSRRRPRAGPCTRALLPAAAGPSSRG